MKNKLTKQDIFILCCTGLQTIIAIFGFFRGNIITYLYLCIPILLVLFNLYLFQQYRKYKMLCEKYDQEKKICTLQYINQTNKRKYINPIHLNKIDIDYKFKESTNGTFFDCELTYIFKGHTTSFLSEYQFELSLDTIDDKDNIEVIAYEKGTLIRPELKKVSNPILTYSIPLLSKKNNGAEFNLKILVKWLNYTLISMPCPTIIDPANYAKEVENINFKIDVTTEAMIINQVEFLSYARDNSKPTKIIIPPFEKNKFNHTIDYTKEEKAAIFSFEFKEYAFI